MILHDLTKTENHPVYQRLEQANLLGLQSFLDSIIIASKEIQHSMVSTVIIKALNHHAISCLHTHAGKYRQCPVFVGEGPEAYEPPPWFNVPDLMNVFVNELNYELGRKEDPILLSAYSLWKLNNIHPFVNGNGRTARALCYYVLCSGSGGLLPGSRVLPELIGVNREEYVDLLKKVDMASIDTKTMFDQALLKFRNFIANLISEQLSSAEN